jgi:hypothetical protein
MSVKSFKFVSPGVFINEIDNSFIPKSADAIGPVVVGRSTRGLALQPTKVESYSEFVEAFGDTMPGNMGGDVYRDGNGQSPMYGTYAAKAFLNANVGPVTYMRLLGAQHTDATSTGYCGWKTNHNGTATLATNGGAYGLWIFASASTTAALGVGNLAAVWYVDNSSSVELHGVPYRAESNKISSSLGGVIGTSTDGFWTVHITGSDGSSEKFKFNFDDSSQHFIRKVFNTNPQLGNAGATDFYNSAVRKTYWLGETYEQTVRTGWGDPITGSTVDQTSGVLIGVMQALNLSGTVGTGPQAMTNPTGGEYVEGKAGWFVGQDLGATAPADPVSTRGSTEYNALTKLFRLVGRGHGEWLQKHAKVSIENIRISTSALSEYGSFSIVLRHINDTDSKVIVLERFDNLTLNPASPDFVARRIGNMYYVWSDSERRLKQYGEFPNQSKFVYVDANEDILDGSAEASLLPFGYYGPPRFKSIIGYTGQKGDTAVSNTFMSPGSRNTRFGYIHGGTDGAGFMAGLWVGNCGTASATAATASFHFPRVRLRNSASDGGMSDPRSAYFGMQTTRSPSSTVADPSIADYHRMLYSGMPDDPSAGGITGVDGYAYIFTLDDVALDNVTATYSYVSGSRNNPQNGLQSYTALSGTSGLLDAGYDKFTAPFFGGFDAVNIYKPDPFYNAGMTEGTSTELNDYIYNTYKRAIDTVSDPEFINMNLLTTPGLTIQSLTTHEVRVCEERADAMALIDLPLVYRPPAEAKLTKPNRVATTPDAAATALRDRQIDSSYGCTFYPWVQTLDEPTSQLLWIPPTVAMLGVLASSQAKSDVWFAPAGFNRGGLTDGAAGIPITNVTERLTSKQRDTLYENSINPIASFPSTGIVLFGQKTLQQRQSALDRINVRRLVIYLKKQISILATQVLFDQNVQSTWDKFVALVDPLLANTQIGFGISDYRLILDDTTTTPDLIDQNILYAKIMVKPARAIEYIAIDFVIMSTGASFDD